MSLYGQWVINIITIIRWRMVSVGNQKQPYTRGSMMNNQYIEQYKKYKRVIDTIIRIRSDQKHCIDDIDMHESEVGCEFFEYCMEQKIKPIDALDFYIDEFGKIETNVVWSETWNV